MRRLLRALKENMVGTSAAGMSLELRLVIMFLVFSTTIILSVSLILVATGVFNAGMRENAALFSSELSHLSRDICDALNNLSLSSVALAEQASTGIEAALVDAGVAPADLSRHPELLESILASEFHTLLDSLQASKSSGAFLILSATANPGVTGSEDSKAGLFLKNMEATAVHSAYYDIRYLRGPASIGRAKKMTLLPQWKMEFQISEADYFNIPMKTATEPHLPLSRLYYWCPKTEFENSDSAMLCSVPLIASDGTVLGVAGFEMESMLFKASYSPDNSRLACVFCMLAPCKGDSLRMAEAMFAGSSVARDIIPTAIMTRSNSASELQRYTSAGESYLGLDSRVTLYPANSPYEQDEWRVALLVPEADLSQQMAKQNRSIALLLVLLTGVCVSLSIRTSRLYLNPVMKAFEAIRSQRIAEHRRTRIPEIDDLMEHLMKEDESGEEGHEAGVAGSSAHGTAVFETFLESIDTLSKAERAVFDLYVKGHTAKEIAEILFLSINTVKTHNKRIYMKLNVSSRKELLVFIRMMQELEGGPPPRIEYRDY